MLLEDQVVLIVGAGPGLGRTLARRCAKEGADLALVARTRETLELTAKEVEALGRRALVVPTDVADPGAVKAMAEVVVGEFGRIDVLVNAAFPGTHRKNVLDMDDESLESWRRSVEIAAFGSLLTCRYVAPYMVRAGRGSIVNVTSMSSRIGYAGRSDYAAGKAAQHKLGQALADELGPLGVRVNAVAPGFIWSDVLKNWMETVAAHEGTTYDAVYARNVEQMALRRIATEDEVASAILFLASDQASGITGATIDVNAGHLFQ